MLDVRRMRVLREVAHRGSFSAAAEALSFTQSAVSQHVAALERESGTRLVERGPRGVRLTDAAQALVAAGVGVTMLPRLALATVHPGVVVRPMPPNAVVRRIWAARLKRAY